MKRIESDENKPTRREFLKTGAAASLGAVAGGSLGAGMGLKPPNVIVFLTDDQAWGDLGCMGAADLRTPHIDAIAASGIRFTNWYSNSPVCSPSRASLLTGRYPANAGVRNILAGERDTAGLSPDVPTLAKALQGLGYQTGMAGKWHLGVAEEFRPHHHGFDEWFGFLAGCIDYYSHIFYWGMAGGKTAQVHDLWRNNEEVFEDGRYFTELITEFAADFVRRAAGNGRPFFLYVPYNAPHYPMHAPRMYLERFPELPWARRIMAAMLSAVDDSVGAIMGEVERAGVRNDTCVFFQSDNGPSREIRNWMDGSKAPYPGGIAPGLKGHKFSLYEGGIRVPGLWSWPAALPAGEVEHTPAAAMDVFPTVLRAAGGDLGAYRVDGADLLPLLTRRPVTGRAPLGERAIFWEYGHQTAVRRGKWKLTINGVLDENAPNNGEVFLADLSHDAGERNNLARERRVAAELAEAAKAWRASVTGG